MSALMHTVAGAGQFWLIPDHSRLPPSGTVAVSQEARIAGALKSHFLWAQVRVEVMVDLGI